MAAFVQESNKKYSDLLLEKLNSEDALKAQFENEKKQLIKDWEKKLKEAVDKARADE